MSWQGTAKWQRKGTIPDLILMQQASKQQQNEQGTTTQEVVKYVYTNLYQLVQHDLQRQRLENAITVPKLLHRENYKPQTTHASDDAIKDDPQQLEH